MNEERIATAKQLLRDGNYSAARIALDEILAEDSQNIVALVGLSTALGHLELLDEALEVAQTALGIEPDNPEVHFRVYLVYYTMGEMHKARDHICRAIVLDPNVAKYHWEMARLANALRDTETAFQCLEVAYRLDPSMFNKRARTELWGLRILVGCIRLRGLIAWGIIATYVLLFEIGHSWFLLKLLVGSLPFIGVGGYYLAQRRYRRALGAFVLGLFWSSATYAIAQWFFLN